MSKHYKQIVVFGIITILVLNIVSFANAETLLLGYNQEFAIDTKEGWKYYTPDSDLTEVSTTAGYLFQNSKEVVCYVVGEHENAVISYYTTDNNNGLSARDKIMKCMSYGFGQAAAFFDDSFMVMPLSGGYLFSGDSKVLGQTVENNNLFIILEHGIVMISSNGGSGSFEMVYELLLDIRFSKNNTIVF